MTSTFFDIVRNGKTVECEIGGQYCGPDYECGITGGYIEDLSCVSLETLDNIELTEEETERAQRKLVERHEEDAEDYE